MDGGNFLIFLIINTCKGIFALPAFRLYHFNTKSQESKAKNGKVNKKRHLFFVFIRKRRKDRGRDSKVRLFPGSQPAPPHFRLTEQQLKYRVHSKPRSRVVGTRVRR